MDPKRDVVVYDRRTRAELWRRTLPDFRTAAAYRAEMGVAARATGDIGRQVGGGVLITVEPHRP